MAETLSHFHDGYVTGLRVRKGGATVYLQTVNGQEFELHLSAVEALQMDDFREGNIISHIEIITGRRPHKETEFNRLFGAPHPSAAAQYHDAHAALLKRQIARIESGQISLVVIVPSYGADLLAVCGEAICRPA